MLSSQSSKLNSELPFLRQAGKVLWGVGFDDVEDSRSRGISPVGGFLSCKLGEVSRNQIHSSWWSPLSSLPGRLQHFDDERAVAVLVNHFQCVTFLKVSQDFQELHTLRGTEYFSSV